MIRKRYLFATVILLVLLTWALQTPAAGPTEEASRPTPEEMAALTGNEPPQTLAEQVRDAIEDTVEVQSVDGRTVLMMEGKEGDEFTLSFSSVAEGVRAHVQLGKGGLKHRFTLVKPEGADKTPIYLDLQGPAVNGGYGVKVTLRF